MTVNDVNDFKRAWKSWHPHSPPVGYMMRGNREPNWLRLHSLPLSKRYAETPLERDIPITRHNEVAAEVLGLNQKCWLAQSCWVTPAGMSEFSNEQLMFSACRDYQSSWSFRFLEDHDDDIEHAWDVHAAMTSWEMGKFDSLLWACANEEAAPIIWTSDNTGVVFAPYDGGIDLFLEDERQVERLSEKYSSWLSTRPDGL